jgi:hypothetical protein
MRLRWIAILGCSIIIMLLLVLILFLGKLVGSTQAQQQPARSETLMVGPYTTVVNLFENPPQVGQPLKISIVPRDPMHLSGQIKALPRAGTDSTPTHASLVADANQPDTLVGSIQLPVRGGWQVVIELDGPKGHGTASFDVDAIVPNALPPWLGWLIGLSPLVGFAWFIWHQWRYRRRLLTAAESSSVNSFY